MKIYVPDLNTYKCFVVREEGVIRAYEQIPANNRTINYRDYYIDSNYIFQDGVQTFSQYSTLPICLDSSNLTSEVYYRNDFDKILLIFVLLCIIFFKYPLKIFSRLFRRL